MAFLAGEQRSPSVQYSGKALGFWQMMGIVVQWEEQFPPSCWRWVSAEMGGSLPVGTGPEGAAQPSWQKGGPPGWPQRLAAQPGKGCFLMSLRLCGFQRGLGRVRVLHQIPTLAALMETLPPPRSLREKNGLAE